MAELTTQSSVHVVCMAGTAQHSRQISASVQLARHQLLDQTVAAVWCLSACSEGAGEAVTCLATHNKQPVPLDAWLPDAGRHDRMKSSRHDR